MRQGVDKYATEIFQSVSISLSEKNAMTQTVITGKPYCTYNKQYTIQFTAKPEQYQIGLNIQVFLLRIPGRVVVFSFRVVFPTVQVEV